MSKNHHGIQPLTAAECRAGRSALGWTQGDLAKKAKVSAWAVSRFERFGYGAENTHMSNSAVWRIREILLDHGILLEQHNGLSVVKFRRDTVVPPKRNGRDGTWQKNNPAPLGTG